jgi:prolyl-tRNA synthetase
VIPVEADSGAMGGSQSMEFMVASDAGEDLVVNCPSCHYAANLEKAVSTNTAPATPDPESSNGPEEFHTPNRKTIAEVAEFTGLPQTSQMKSLVMVADGKPVLALLRGDHQLSETKFAAAIRGVLKMSAVEVRPAHPGEINDWFGADPGSLGPIGITNMPILADIALHGRRNMIAGANKNDHHLRNVTPGIDFKPEVADIRQVSAGDSCTSCGGLLNLHKTIEVGHIFKLGYKYSDSMGLRVLDATGAEVTPIMGSYGIGIERILSSSVEQFHDDAGMFLPAPIAPFAVIITPVNNADALLRDSARRIYDECLAAGIDALYDDRDERPGVKFKDADLIGVPYRVTVGKKLAQGAVELVTRKARASRDVPVASVVAELRKAIDDEIAAAVWPK